MPTNDRLRELFIQQIQKFSSDIRKILEGDNDADMYLNALDTMVQITPDMVSSFFRDYIAVPYTDMIQRRDEAFLSSELSDKMKNVPGPFADLHHKIHNQWSSLSEKDKNIIWDYFRVLSKISIKM